MDSHLQFSENIFSVQYLSHLSLWLSINWEKKFHPKKYNYSNKMENKFCTFQFTSEIKKKKRCAVQFLTFSPCKNTKKIFFFFYTLLLYDLGTSENEMQKDRRLVHIHTMACRLVCPPLNAWSFYDTSHSL